MKRSFVYILFMLLLFLTNAGCKKFITKDIVGQYPESEFYTTQAQACSPLMRLTSRLALQLLITTGYGCLVTCHQTTLQRVGIPVTRQT
jgi:hypothetical protein